MPANFFKPECQARSALLIIGMVLVLGAAQARTPAQEAAPEQRAARIEGTVNSAAGAPIAGVSVILHSQSEAKSMSATTNSQGGFVFLKLEPGAYAIAARKEGWGRSADQSIAVRSGDAKRIDLILEAIQAKRDESGSGSTPNAAATMQFSDAASFTVAGVTDYSGAGGHGSETGLRTSEALTRDTVVLKLADVPGASHQDAHELELERERLRKLIAAGDRAELHSLLADVDERLNDPVAAVHEYEMAALLDPSENRYFAWGTELLLHRAAGPASEVFKKGTMRYPKSARMLAGLGAALYAAGSQEQAARRFCEASDLDPTRAEIYEFLGELEKTSTSSVPSCVRQKLSRFVQEQPNNPRANYNYAMALWKQNRGSSDAVTLDQSSRLLATAIAADPSFGEAYLLLGRLRAELGDLSKAAESYQKAIAVAPNLPEAHYRLGLAYRRMGEQSKAQEEFEKYEQMQATQNATIERDRRELRQFLILMKEQPSVAH